MTETCTSNRHKKGRWLKILVVLGLSVIASACEVDRSDGHVNVEVSGLPSGSLRLTNREAHQLQFVVEVNDNVVSTSSFSIAPDNDESVPVSIPLNVPESDPSTLVFSWYFGSDVLLARYSIEYSFDVFGNTVTVDGDDYMYEQRDLTCSGIFHNDTDCVLNIKEYYRGTDPKVDDVLPVMASIPPLDVQAESSTYCFLLGSPPDEGSDPTLFEDIGGRIDRENQFSDCFCRGYQMSSFEITFAQFAAFADETPGIEPVIPVDPEQYSHPVVRVSALDAELYTQWVSARSTVPSPDLQFRLPTEAEWEYAARAALPSDEYSTFTTGSDLLTSQANYASTESTPVGTYSANAWGLFDVHGNVQELTCSFYDQQPYTAGGNAFTCTPFGGAGRRALRGGAFDRTKTFQRTASRTIGAQGEQDESAPSRFDGSRSEDNTGFRIALSTIDPGLLLCP